MSKHIQLEQVGLHGVVFKVGRDDVTVRVVRRMLDGTEVIDLLILGNDHHSARMLSGGAFDAGAADGQPVLFRL